MSDSVKLSGELKQALAEAQGILSERQRIQVAIEKAETELPLAQVESDHALLALGEAEADAALGGDPTCIADAQQRLAREQLAVTTIQVRITALQKRLLSRDDAILVAVESLNGARHGFIGQWREQLNAEYAAAVAELAKVLRRTFAVEDALGIRLPGLHEIRLPNLSGPGLAWDHRPSKYEKGAGVLQEIPLSQWRDDAKATGLHAELSPICKAARKLEALAAEVEKRRHAERQREVTEQFHKGPKTATPPGGDPGEPPSPAADNSASPPAPAGDPNRVTRSVSGGFSTSSL